MLSGSDIIVIFLFIGKDYTTLSDFPNYSGYGSHYSVLGIFFSLPSTPRPTKYAYNPPNLCLLTHFWRIITRFSQIFCPFFCPFLTVETYKYQSITIENLVEVRKFMDFFCPFIFIALTYFKLD